MRAVREIQRYDLFCFGAKVAIAGSSKSAKDDEDTRNSNGYQSREVLPRRPHGRFDGNNGADTLERAVGETKNADEFARCGGGTKKKTNEPERIANRKRPRGIQHLSLKWRAVGKAAEHDSEDG